MTRHVELGVACLLKIAAIKEKTLGLTSFEQKKSGRLVFLQSAVPYHQASAFEGLCSRLSSKT